MVQTSYRAPDVSASVCANNFGNLSANRARIDQTPVQSANQVALSDRCLDSYRYTLVPPTPAPFEEQLTDSFLELRRSLTTLVNACGSKPTQPQDMARNLGVNRNLTWKLS